MCVLAGARGVVSLGDLPGAGCCSGISSGLYHGLPVSLLEAPCVQLVVPGTDSGVESEQLALGGLRVETSVALANRLNCAPSRLLDKAEPVWPALKIHR